VSQHDSKIAQAILKTLVFFDIFDYPLTLIEIWQYLYAPGENKISVGAVSQELNNPELKSKIGFAQGFYFIQGKESNINLRKQRYLIAEPKLKKAKLFIKYLRHLGGVRAVAISNTLALHHSRVEADIDLFIITRFGRIWSTRFWSLLPLYVLGKRPTPQSTRDKFCLSFWVDEKHLDISPWRLERDIYYIYWLATLMPIYGQNVFNKFCQENKWINEYLPNFSIPQTSTRLKVRKSWRLPMIGESFFKSVQIKIMPQELKTLGGSISSAVVIKDGVLKFHPTDRRKEFQKIFDNTYKRITAQ
jgi:hypothetical protein